ncbi:MarR family winged helix-turn-helix transcriptional regulator [Burkholderia sp. 3C]
MLPDCYCIQFRRAANALTGIYDQVLRPTGLKATQFALLRVLARLESATFTEIATITMLDKTTISRNMKVLIQSGWVTVFSEGDARFKVARLSESGTAKLRDAEPHWQAAQAHVEGDVQQYLQGTASKQLVSALEALHQPRPDADADANSAG